MRLFQLGAGVGGCRVCNQSVFLAQRLLISGHLFHRTCFKCARCSALLSVANYYETQDGKYCCETCPDEERTVSPTVSSTTAATTTPQSQQPSLVGDRRALFETLAAADCTDDVKASKKAQRPVTLKMVDPLTTTTTAAAEKSAVTCSDDNDSGVVVVSDKKESSDAKTSASVTGSRETLSDVVAVVADEDGESALPPTPLANDRVTDGATAAAVVVSDQLPDVGDTPVVESSPPTPPLSDDSKRPDDEIAVEPSDVQIPPISDDLKQVLELPPASKAPAEEQLESPEDYEIKTLSNKLLKMDYYESNKEVPVPSPRKRIKSPIKINYPENLNPFDDEEDDGNKNKNDSTNPFGSDFEDEELSVKKNVSLNPFSSDEDDNEPVSQPPLPKPR